MSRLHFSKELTQLDKKHNKTYNWIFTHEFSIGKCCIYVFISNKGDIVYISTDEYKLDNNENIDLTGFFIKRRIRMDNVYLTSFDVDKLQYSENDKISKDHIIKNVDSIFIEKIKSLVVN